jgi:hypothetical protein
LLVLLLVGQLVTVGIGVRVVAGRAQRVADLPAVGHAVAVGVRLARARPGPVLGEIVQLVAVGVALGVVAACVEPVRLLPLVRHAVAVAVLGGTAPIRYVLAGGDGGRRHRQGAERGGGHGEGELEGTLHGGPSGW